MIWLVLGVLTILVLAVLLWPLLSRFHVPAVTLQHDLEVYRDQLREIQAELAAGGIDAEEAKAAEQEVNRRILNAADRPEAAYAVSDRWRAGTAGVVAIVVPGIAALLYAGLGQPWEPAKPLASRTDLTAPPAAAASAAAEPSQQASSIQDMAMQLEQRLADNPNDREGWILMGRTHWELRQFDKAIAAYQKAKALSLTPDANLEMALGEAYVYSADGMVTPAAKGAFSALLAIDPKHPGGRYYLGLADFQASRHQEAYDQWLALANDTPEGAPWIPVLKSRLEEVGAALNIDVAAVLPSALTAPPPSAQQPPAGAPAAPPGPTQEDMAAAAQMSPEERMEFIRSMVTRLADRLKDEPDDAEGWQRLARAYSVLKEQDKALLAYGELARLKPDDIPTLEQYASALLESRPPNSADFPAEAVDIYQRILSLQPNHGMALYITGAAAARRGDVTTAIDAWEKLLAVMPPTAPQYNQLKQELEKIKAEKG